MLRLNKNFVLSILSAFIPFLVIILVGHQPNDDAYITFKHSRNFSEYNQLIWNIYDSEKTLGSSTPFFAFLLGVLGKFSPEKIPIISLYLNAFILSGIVIIIYFISYSKTKSSLLSFSISLVIGINSYCIRIYSYGFEFALFTFLILVNIYLFFKAKYESHRIIALLLPNIIILTRLEGIFIYPLVILILGKWYKEKSINRYYLFLPFSFIFYLVFAYFYYDQILPQSIIAKKIEKELRPLLPVPKNWEELILQKLFLIDQLWGAAFAPIIRLGTEPAALELARLPYTPGNFLLNSNKSLLLYSIILMIYILYKYFKEKKILYLYYYLYFPFFVLFVVYSIRVESWYFPPAITSFLLFILIGTVLFFQEIEIKIKKKYSYNLNLSKYLSLIFILLFAGKNSYIVNKGNYPFDEYRGLIYPIAMRDYVEYERYLAYKDTIEFLHNNQYKGEIATPEVGILGFYYKNGTILDLFGLSTKRITNSYIEYTKQKTHENFMIYILEKYKSNIVVYFYHPSDNDIQEYLKKHYNLVFVHPKYTIFSNPLNIWIRK